MKISKIIILLMISVTITGQTDKIFLKNWKSYPIPTDPDTIQMYNWDKNDWVVYLDGNEIMVDDIRNKWEDLRAKPPFEIKQSKRSNTTNISAPLAGLVDVVNVQDGFLIGFNRGEWGGELYWFSKDGEKRYEISKHQIVKFIERDNKIYAIAGLAHLGMSDGSIIEIEKKKRKWVAKEFLELPAAPYAVQSDSKDNFVIITSPGLFSIDKKANMDTLSINALPLPENIDEWTKNAFYTFGARGLWGQLYPNSMVIQNDIIYVGMRKGVYKFDLATKNEEWLLYE